jgi:hypothetical protein
VVAATTTLQPAPGTVQGPEQKARTYNTCATRKLARPARKRARESRNTSPASDAANAAATSQRYGPETGAASTTTVTINTTIGNPFAVRRNESIPR